LTNYNLIRKKWIPVKRLNGEDRIAPFEITSQYDSNPIVAFAWPRPDFDLASYEFLIGLLAAIYPADPREPKQWMKLFHTPPSPDELAAAFEPFADAFVLDGDGPRFLQEFDELDGDELPLESLFIEAPGANTIELNADLFIKRGRARILSRASAAMAIYTLQQFAPSGGVGYRTSLRRGGPLVTLALPDGGKITRTTLWQRLWLNTPADLRLDPSAKSRAFPWLTPTRASENGETVHEADAHKLQAFFGMPRRIRLVFTENIEKRPCDLTGIVDEGLCTGLARTNYGIHYGTWRHPDTPYRKAKANSPGKAVPTPAGRLGYRDWLGFAYQSEEIRAANSILNAKHRLCDLGPPWRDNSRLLAGGFAIVPGQAKALAFAEAKMPLHRLDPELAQDIENFARLMVNAASEAVKILGKSLRLALFGPKSEVKTDQTILDGPRERFWEITEDDFHQMLDTALTSLADDPQGDEQEKLAQAWRQSLERAALSIFDDTAPVDSLGELDPENVVEGRKLLVLSLKGYGKPGADFFKALGNLDPPETKENSGRTSMVKSKKAISQ
jgi:CRISPR system Cascade subunit CasA